MSFTKAFDLLVACDKALQAAHLQASYEFNEDTRAVSFAYPVVFRHSIAPVYQDRRSNLSIRY